MPRNIFNAILDDGCLDFLNNLTNFEKVGTILDSGDKGTVLSATFEIQNLSYSTETSSFLKSLWEFFEIRLSNFVIHPCPFFVNSAN